MNAQHPLGTLVLNALTTGANNGLNTHYVQLSDWDRPVDTLAERDAIGIDPERKLNAYGDGSGQRTHGMTVLVRQPVDNPAAWKRYRLEIPSYNSLPTAAAKADALANNANWKLFAGSGTASPATPSTSPPQLLKGTVPASRKISLPEGTISILLVGLDNYALLHPDAYSFVPGTPTLTFLTPDITVGTRYWVVVLLDGLATPPAPVIQAYSDEQAVQAVQNTGLFLQGPQAEQARALSAPLRLYPSSGNEPLLGYASLAAYFTNGLLGTLQLNRPVITFTAPSQNWLGVLDGQGFSLEGSGQDFPLLATAQLRNLTARNLRLVAANTDDPRPVVLQNLTLEASQLRAQPGGSVAASFVLENCRIISAPGGVWAAASAKVTLRGTTRIETGLTTESGVIITDERPQAGSGGGGGETAAPTYTNAQAVQAVRESNEFTPVATFNQHVSQVYTNPALVQAVVSSGELATAGALGAVETDLAELQTQVASLGSQGTIITRLQFTATAGGAQRFELPTGITYVDGMLADAGGVSQPYPISPGDYSLDSGDVVITANPGITAGTVITATGYASGSGSTDGGSGSGNASAPTGPTSCTVRVGSPNDVTGTGVSLAASTYQHIVFDTVIDDLGGHWNNTDSSYLVPVSGEYQVTTEAFCLAGMPGQPEHLPADLYYYWGPSTQPTGAADQMLWSRTTGNFNGAQHTWLPRLTAGQRIYLVAYLNGFAAKLQARLTIRLTKAS